MGIQREKKKSISFFVRKEEPHHSSEKQQLSSFLISFRLPAADAGVVLHEGAESHAVGEDLLHEYVRLHREDGIGAVVLVLLLLGVSSLIVSRRIIKRERRSVYT